MSMQAIEHVVVLMLENRSMDSMLGWLYEQGQPNVFIPSASSSRPFDGLQGVDLPGFTNTSFDGSCSSPPLRGASGYNTPAIDPGEEYEHVNRQFFNNPAGQPVGELNMRGYVADFVLVMEALGMDASAIRAAAPQVMESYTPAQLPVLNQLARAYAVSDAWYASVPSQTNPNRSFLMCGTSNGMVNNGELEMSLQAKALERLLGMAIGDDRVNAPTVFNALAANGTSWGVYYQTGYLPQKIAKLVDDAPRLIEVLTVLDPPLGLAIAAAWALLSPFADYMRSLSSGELESCYTWRLFPQIQQIPGAAAHFMSLDDFHAQAQAGTLPAFSYIEPLWTISQVSNNTSVPRNLVTQLGNDYHPPSNLLVGEAFVKSVYTSLIANKAAWQKTALLITFDEFVGSFDHETEGLQPGLVVPPWGVDGKPLFKSPTGFDFRRLGGRVPTVLVSPYVEAGTVFRASGTPYDHSAVIATVLKRFNPQADLTPFGERVKNAPTFDDVFTRTTPRDDAASLPFVDRIHQIGDPVNYGDSFLLVNQNGHQVTASVIAPKAGSDALIPASLLPILADLDVAAYFPTWGTGQAAPLSFISPGPDGAGPVCDGATLLLVTREVDVGAMNILGAWRDSHDCYWYNQYFDGPEAPKQMWLLAKTSNPGEPLAYGDSFTLASAVDGSFLQPDDRWITLGNWLTTGAGASTWTVMPAPLMLPGQ